jgi:low temperature requirement protein LtrA
MTLWQMMAVASLAVTLSGPHVVFISRTTYALVFLQIYITYLWWSVGIYDKDHRKLNRPYTACYLAALVLIIGTLYVSQPFKRLFWAAALILNYLPPFITGSLLKKKGLSLNLSPSMVERLGLFTIIVFGEVILGVITGASGIRVLGIKAWACFGTGILIVFALWWIFFSLIADREIQKEYLKWQSISLLYIPTLASLGIVGALFPGLMKTLEDHLHPEYAFSIRSLFGVSLSVFLVSIWAISRHLNYPKEYEGSKKILRPTIILAAVVIILITLLAEYIALIYYLIFVFSILLVIIITLTRMWFRIELQRLDAVTNEARQDSH